MFAIADITEIWGSPRELFLFLDMSRDSEAAQQYIQILTTLILMPTGYLKPALKIRIVSVITTD